VTDEWNAERPRRSARGQIVGGGAKPASHNHGVDAVNRRMKRRHDVIDDVAHRGVPARFESRFAQLLRDERRVRINNGAARHLVADRDDFDRRSHARSLPRSRLTVS
jgi:hypothetical protein